MKTIKGIEFLGAPLYVLDPEDTGFEAASLKEGTSCYVIGGNGMHTIERMKNQITVRRTTGCGLELADIKEGVSWVGKPIDADTFSFLDGLFRAVFEKYSTEAVVLLYQDPSKGEWYARVPEQEVTAASAKWKDGKSVWYKDGKKLDKVPDGLVMSGSAHSHGSMGAFFSGGDDADDNMTSGLHLVFGGYAKSKVVARITGGGKKVDIEPDKVTLFHNPLEACKIEVPDLIKTVTPGVGPVITGRTTTSVANFWNQERENTYGGRGVYPPKKLDMDRWFDGFCSWDKTAQKSPEKPLTGPADIDDDDHAPDPVINPNGDDAVFAEWELYEPDDFDSMSDEDLVAYREFLLAKHSDLEDEAFEVADRLDIIQQMQEDRGITEEYQKEEIFQR